MTTEPRPETGAVAEDIYQSVLPAADQDGDLGWPLLIFVTALGLMFEEIEGYVRDTEDGPGWSSFVDINRAPADAIAFLGQMVGVSVQSGIDETIQREAVRDTGGFRRGTLASMRSAIAKNLSGTDPNIIISERDGGPYKLTVITQPSETPDHNAVLEAIRNEKPAGITLTYQYATTSMTYLELRATNTDYTAARSSFANYNEIKNS